MRRSSAILTLVLTLGHTQPALTRAGCGDGVHEPDYELCDDGAVNGTNGCCTPSCSLFDADGDMVCDAKDPCASPAPSFADASLVVKGFATAAADDTFRLTGTLAPGAAVDPASTGLTFVLSNDYTGVFARAAIAGGAGWRPAAHGAWSYRDPLGAVGGARVTIKPLSDGRLALTIKGRRSDYARSTNVRPIRVALGFGVSTADVEQCGEAFLAIHRCTFTSSGNTLRCLPPEEQRRCPSDVDGRVRCDARNAAAAQDAYFAAHNRYYSGDCAGLPGFVPSPEVLCTTSGTTTYGVATAAPTTSVACVYSSNPNHLGEPNLVCS